MKIQIIAVTAVLAVLTAFELHAGITSVSDSFSNKSNTYSNWTSVGSVTGSSQIQFESSSVNDYDRYDHIQTQANPLDGDGIVGNLAGDTEPTGDGLLHDGGLMFNSLDATPGNEAIGLTLEGAMSTGEQYTLSVGLYNDGTSFWSGQIQLFDLTTSTILAQTANSNVGNNGNTSYVPVTWTLGYTAQAADEGHTLQIRVVENANNTSRDGYLDNFSLNVIAVPEPSTVAIIAGGFGMLIFTTRRRIGRRG